MHFARGLRLSVSLLALSIGAGLAVTPAAAQPESSQPPAPADQTTPPPQSGPVEKVVVTGSRIPRPNLQQPNPVTTVTSERIENSGTSNLGDIVAQFPALSANGTVRANSDSFADIGGLNFPDLRSLGTARTLTLVNGKRHVSGDAGDSAVDFNAIPPALVERVEVVTGGASAIYGSDAVTGVINVILRDDFEGMEVSAQAGTPTDGGHGQNYSASLSVGSNFADDRGNAVISIFYDRTSPATANDIDALDDWGTVVNPANTGENDGIPDRLLVAKVVSELIDEHSVVTSNSLPGFKGFSINGVPVDQPPRTLSNSQAFGVVPGCETCFELEDWILLIPDTKRTGIAGNVTYDISPSVKFTADVKYVTTDIFDYVQPSFTFFGETLSVDDNPFIDPGLRAEIQGLGDDTLFLARFNGDVGARTRNITRETFRVVGGLDGEFDADFANMGWEISYNYGETRNKFSGDNYLIPGNFTAALDAVVDPGDLQIKCRSDVPAMQGPGYTPPAGMTGEACVPFNPFGEQNSAAALDYVSHSQQRLHTITQEVVQAVFHFDTERFLTLPGGAIAFAGGVEHREESSANINDAFVQSGLSETAPQPDAVGGFKVSEGFIETSIPLLADTTLAERLTIDGAYRYADYSHAGIARAWKVGGFWAPINDLAFRGTYAIAVRAPNITEAFLPPTAAFFQYADPCDATALADDPDRPANCALLGIPQPFTATDNQSVPGTSSGNSGLTPEEATTKTFGIVIQPRWIKGLSLTVDYYDIEITDAIRFIQAQEAVDNCVDSSGGLDPAFCNLVIRDPVTHQVTTISSTFVNATSLLTKGWDIQLAYAHDVGELTEGGFLSDLDGRASLTLVANHVEKLRIFPFATDPTNENVEEGEVGDPTWSFTTNLVYDQGPLTFVWRSRWENEVATIARGVDIPEDLSPAFIEAVWYHDFVVRYQVNAFGERDTELFVGVNNAFGEEIPFSPLGGNGTAAAYDLLGRYVFAGATAKF
jgi:iron complex outermembrane receptor protein